MAQSWIRTMVEEPKTSGQRGAWIDLDSVVGVVRGERDRLSDSGQVVVVSTLRLYTSSRNECGESYALHITDPGEVARVSSLLDLLAQRREREVREESYRRLPAA